MSNNVTSEIKRIKKNVKRDGAVLAISNWQLLLGKSLKINDDITICNPTVGEVMEYGEEKYNKMLNRLIIQPSICKKELYNMGIDYKKVSDFELFYIVTRVIKQEDTEILLGDLDLAKFELYVYEETGEVVMYYEERDITIDQSVYVAMVDCIRRMHGIQDSAEESGHECESVELMEWENKPFVSVYQTLVDGNIRFKTMAMSTLTISGEGLKAMAKG